MRFFYSFVSVVFFCFGLTAPSLVLSAPDEAAGVRIQHWKTRSGVPVYFVASKAIPMLDFAVSFTAGSAYDGQQEGLANFVANTLEEGTLTRDADTIARLFDDIGAHFSAHVSRDVTVVSLRTLTKPAYLSRALALFQNLLVQANFPEVGVERVRRQILASIREADQSPAAKAHRLFMRKLFGSHPYAHPIFGTSASVAALQRAALFTFHRRYYVAKNARLMLVGDVSRTKAAQIAEQLAAALPEGRPAAPLAVAMPRQNALSVHAPFASQQAAIVLGVLGVSHDSPDYFPLIVGANALGGRGLTSILFKTVRSKHGLAYGVSSKFDLWRYRGPFLVALNTRAEKAKEARALTTTLLKKFVRKGPTASQLKSAKDFMIGAFPLSIATNAAKLSQISTIAFYHLPLNYLSTYRAKLRAVTVAAVKKAFARAIDVNRLLTVTVGPATEKVTVR